MTAWRIAAGVAALTLASGAGAQQCEVNTSSPYQIRGANVYIRELNMYGGKPDEELKHARNAVRNLTDDAEKINNQLGRNYLLAQVLAWYTKPGNGGWVMKRGDIGYTTNPDQMLDLAAGIDTALTAMIASNPACSAKADSVRLLVWPSQINKVQEMITANKVDSAEILLERSRHLNPKSPYNAYYGAMLLQNKGEKAADEYYSAYQQATAASATDKTDATLKMAKTSLYNSGVLAINEANALEGAEKTARMKVAIARLKEYQSKYPTGEEAVNVQGALARALAASGDTAAASGLFSDMLVNPAKYQPFQLFEAAVAAVKANHTDDAIKLLEAGLERNPYHRDALYNLGTLYHGKKEFDKMEPIVTRLLELDPNNSQNLKLYAALLSGPAAEYQAEAEKLRGNRSKRAEFDAATAKLKAQNDSVIKYVQLATTAPVSLKVTSSAFGKENVKIAGTVENRSDTQKSFDVKFDVLNATGATVGTGSTTVDVAPKSTGSFSLEIAAKGAVAWKNAPLQ
jgi:tetratricopeptide (TPR) repeat protein